MSTHPSVQEERKKLEFSNVFFHIFALVAFSFVVFYFKDIREDFLLFREVEVRWVVLALLAQLGTYLFNALVYYDLLGIYKLTSFFKIPTLLQANVVTLFFNQSVPSVGLSGNAFYFSFLSKRGVSYERAFSLVLVELICFYLALIFAFMMLLGVVGFSERLFFFVLLWGILAYGVLAVCITELGDEGVVKKILGYIRRFSLGKKILSLFQRIPTEVKELHTVEPPWNIFLKNKRASFAAVAFQFCILLFDSLTIYALFKGLQVDISFFKVFMGFMLTKALTSFPTSPGGLIVYESSMTFLYVTLGVPLSAAVTATLLYRVLSFWLPMPFGLFFYRRLSRQNN